MIKMLPITRRTCLATAGAALLARPAAAAQPCVVELYTSQGCSSCPPADAFMEELSRRDDVIAMSFNVDYWDYLGWKDTLGSPDNSKRQYDYAKSRGDMDVYTPQMIVNGRGHYVGSNRASVTDAIAGAKNLGWLPLRLEAAADEIVAHIPQGEGHATLWLMAVAGRVTVQVERGENAGKEITYASTVRRCEAAGMWKGEALTVRLPRAALTGKDATHVVALLQEGHVGPVIGAAKLPLTTA